MRRLTVLATTVAVLAVVLAGATGCGQGPVPAATAHEVDRGGAALSGTGSGAARSAESTQAEIYARVLRQYIGSSSDNPVPPNTITTVYVLDRAYPDAADPMTTQGPGTVLDAETQHRITAEMAGLADVVFIADRMTVIESPGGCQQVRAGSILVTLGVPQGDAQEVHVGINGFVACAGATWLTYVVRPQPGTGWQVTGTTGPHAIA